MDSNLKMEKYKGGRMLFGEFLNILRVREKIYSTWFNTIVFSSNHCLALFFYHHLNTTDDMVGDKWHVIKFLSCFFWASRNFSRHLGPALAASKLDKTGRECR